MGTGEGTVKSVTNPGVPSTASQTNVALRADFRLHSEGREGVGGWIPSCSLGKRETEHNPMQDLFMRTLSHALQAAVPIGLWWAWLQHHGARENVRSLRTGLIAALSATPAAAYVFGSMARPMILEAALAIIATLMLIRGVRGLSSSLALHIGVAVIVVRETMVVGSTLWLVLVSAGSLQATVVTVGAIALAVIVALAIVAAERTLQPAAFRAACLTGFALFFAQTAFASIHKLAESRLLGPSSAAIDAATEPYGPDGIYGFYASYLLAILPFGVAMLAGATRRFRKPLAIGAGSALGIAVMIGLMGRAPLADGNPAPAPEPATVTTVPVAAEVSAVAAAPHILFRGSRQDANYGKMALTSLGAPGTTRAVTAFGCERVSYGVSHGICLHADRGLRTTYSAILFDSNFQQTKVLPLEGEPSRTRISRDGRVGAMTVFVTGIPHGYASALFSTATTLVNMATGDVIGNLEEFATFRDGKRIKEDDFNFWGVTFAKDSNTFYATLLSKGRTHLVRGDLGLRTLTVIYDGLECPSLSPDDKLIAFKKKVGPSLAPWRIYILDLATMTEHPVAAESRSIDDQMEWLDTTHILYAAPRSSQSAIRDVWVAPIDATGPAKVFLPEAESPIIVR